MRTYSTEELLESISRRGSFEFKENAITREVALAMADDELQTVIVPMLLSLRSKYLLASLDYTTTESLRYAIPPFAIGRSIQNIAFVDASGRESELTFVDHDLEMAGSSWDAWARGYLNGRDGYYLSGDDVVLYPQSRAGLTLRIFYYRLPNRLALIENCAQVTAVDSGTGIVSVSDLPLEWTAGIRLCCVAGVPGFTLRFEARSASAAGSGTVTLADVSSITVGDWLAEEGDSPIPQIPVEAHPLLAQAAVVKLHESLGDPRLVNAQAKYKEIRDGFMVANTPRVEQAPKMMTARRGLLGYI
jgi:hypothetical protein